MNVCALHSTVSNNVFSRCTCNGISCKGADQLDYSQGCLKGISDNIPTLASHGMKFIEILIQNTWKLEVYSINDLPCAQAYFHFLEVQSKFSRYTSGQEADVTWRASRHRDQ